MDAPHSRRQDSLLNELREQTRRIEHLSQVEHDPIQEVHPKVEEISQDLGRVAEAVKTAPPQQAR